MQRLGKAHYVKQDLQKFLPAGYPNALRVQQHHGADGRGMGRHEIPARNPAHKIIVGWDHPLSTFFVQVIDRAKEAAGEDEKFVLWLGCSALEIYEVNQLARIVGPYGELTGRMAAALYGDKDEGR
jgi:hypothetical protein